MYIAAVKLGEVEEYHQMNAHSSKVEEYHQMNAYSSKVLLF